MTALTYFTVTGTYLAAVRDSVLDVDTNPELVPLWGTVTFTPLISVGDSIPATTLTPPANLFLPTIKAQIRDGEVWCNGSAGVKLVANTAVLGLVGDLFYQVNFGGGLTAGGKNFVVSAFVFTAPTTAVTMDLIEVTPATGQPATGPVPSSAVLSVAGRTGNVVVTAGDVVGVELAANKNTANGYPGLDGGGKISASQLPISAMEYKGTWNASTNSPTLADGTGSAGDVYKVAIGATRNLGSGSVTWDVGDYVIYNGTTWEKDDTTVAWGSIPGQPAVVAAGADTATARAAIGAAKRVNYLVDDYGPVDYTGATSSAVAIAAAKSAMGTNKGVLVFGPGIVDSGTAGLGTFQQGQGCIGAGKGATRVKYSGTGDCIRARDTRAWVDIFGMINDTAGPGFGGMFAGFTIDGTGAGASANGLHMGDLHGPIVDLWIVNFTGATAKGAWFDNTVTWLERANVRLVVENCKQQVVFDAGNGGFASFDYSYWNILLQARANQDGVVLKGNLEMAGCEFILRGSADPHGASTNSGTILKVGTTAGDTSNIYESSMHVTVEMGSETDTVNFQGHKSLDIGAAALIWSCEGEIRFPPRAGGHVQYQASSTGAGVRIPDFFGNIIGCSDVPAGVALTTPRIDSISDSNGKTIIDLLPTANAVNRIAIGNHTTGNFPYVMPTGPDASIDVAFLAKGPSGRLQFLDRNFLPVLVMTPGVASAVNYLYMSNAATGNRPFLGAAGTDPNVSLDLQTQGSGRVTNNGVNVPTVSSTDTFTGKRITLRIGTVTSSATPTINVDAVDQFNITALAVAITSFTANLTGTPTDGQLLDVRIKGTATRAIAWGALFTGTLLSTTSGTNTHLQRLKWDAAASKFAGYYADATGY